MPADPESTAQIIQGTGWLALLTAAITWLRRQYRGHATAREAKRMAEEAKHAVGALKDEFGDLKSEVGQLRRDCTQSAADVVEIKHKVESMDAASRDYQLKALTGLARIEGFLGIERRNALRGDTLVLTPPPVAIVRPEPPPEQ